MPRQRVGRRRVTNVGRINYNRKRAFRLQDVARICDKLFNEYTEVDTERNAPDSTVFYLWQLFGDWMQFRGLYDQIYGSKGGLGWYLEFLLWFDKIIAGLEVVLDTLDTAVPELKLYTEFVRRSASLYQLVRGMYKQ